MKETVNREKNAHSVEKTGQNRQDLELFHQSLISVVNQTRCRDIASRQENYQNFSPSRENAHFVKHLKVRPKLYF